MESKEKKKVGRKSTYSTKIEPNLDKITEWLGKGWTVQEICDEVGINKSTWYDYAAKHSDFADAIKKARKPLVSEIKAAMVQRAKGFQFTETKKIYAIGDDGKMKLVRIEEVVKTQPGDIAAQHLLLKNWDEDWHDDPQLYELKKREQESREKHREASDW